MKPTNPSRKVQEVDESVTFSCETMDLMTIRRGMTALDVED